MKGISEFFDKFRSRAVQEVSIRIKIAESIKEYINIDVPIEKINIKNGIIKIMDSSGAKNEIFIKKQKIIDSISRKIPNLKVIDLQ